MSWLSLKKRTEHFFLEPTLTKPIAVLRIGVSLVLLCQALSIAPIFMELYGEAGIIQAALSKFLSYYEFFPRLSWFHAPLESLGIEYAQVVRLFFGLYLATLVGLFLGVKTRAFAIAAWILHVLLLNSGPASNYGVDQYAQIILFYLVCMPKERCLSIDSWLDPSLNQATPNARLWLRVLQIHLCFSYLAAGVTKALGIEWWNGEAMWRALMLPEYRHLDWSWFVDMPWVPMLLGWATLLVEIGYPFFIWPKATRKLWIWLTTAMHIGIAFFMGLWFFGWLLALLTFAAFGIDNLSAKDNQLKAPAPQPTLA